MFMRLKECSISTLAIREQVGRHAHKKKKEVFSKMNSKSLANKSTHAC